MNYPQVGLILLAAGESKRMGKPKQLLSYRGNSLIRHAATEAIASDCEPVIVVLGAYGDRLTPELDKLSVHICRNLQWQQGMSSSISTGVKALLELKSDLDAAIVALVDQPLITSKTYNRLIKRYRETKLRAIASIYTETIGVPALFDCSLFNELSGLEGKGGAKQLLRSYTNPQHNLTVPEAAIDLDTPNDYQQLLKL